MIASAIRSVIQRFRPMVPSEAFARCATAARMLTAEGVVSPSEAALPSMRALGELVARDATASSGRYLAYVAFVETMVARANTDSEAASRAEVALDRVDAVVTDPHHLAGLRDDLRAFIARFEQLCFEAVPARRAPRELPAFAP